MNKKEREIRRKIIENNLCQRYIPILSDINVIDVLDVLSTSELIAIYEAASNYQCTEEKKEKYNKSLNDLKHLIYNALKYGETHFYIIKEKDLCPYNDNILSMTY